MSIQSISNRDDLFPSVFNDFFEPVNSWFDKNAADVWGKRFTVPAVNVMENSENFEITIAVPGIKKDDLYVSVEGSILTVGANAALQKETKEGKYNRKEYNYSSFTRRFTLPAGIVNDKITAACENGELLLTLPKTEETRKTALKQIAVH